MTRFVWPLLLVLAGCASSPQAPVVERPPAPKPHKPAAMASQPAKPVAQGDTYIVRKGDTLYSIGVAHNADYRDIAQWNDIAPPYQIQVGQQLRVKAPAPASGAETDGGVVVTPLGSEPAPVAKPLDGSATASLATPAAGGVPLLTQPQALKQPYSEKALALATPEPAAPPAAPAPAAPTAGDDSDGIVWAWPANGKVIGNSAKGIDIAGSHGQPVLAAAAGKVVYSGAGLRGYGNLVIIKHNDLYLSAYAHNSKLLVKEGQAVAKGQKIAEMGSSDASQVQLHFEIRKQGKPVDPTRYLPAAPG